MSDKYIWANSKQIYLETMFVQNRYKYVNLETFIWYLFWLYYLCRFLFCKSWSTSMMRCMSINNQSFANINIQFRFNFGFHNFQTMCCTYESWMHFLFLGNVFQFSENVFLVSGNVFHWHLRSLGALIDRGANVRCISSDWLREDKPQRFYNYQLSGEKLRAGPL